MKGFDTKALILFSNYNTFENKSNQYKFLFKRAVTNLITYFHAIDIEPYVFYTDDIARDLRCEGFNWIGTLGTSDKFFLSKYCANFNDALTISLTENTELINDILRKDPTDPNMSTEERFEQVLRHNAKAVSKIIPTYKIVVNFKVKGKTSYKVVSRSGDGKIRIEVNTNTFIPTVFMSGKEEDACDLLNVPYGNQGLDNWFQGGQLNE